MEDNNAPPATPTQSRPSGSQGVPRSSNSGGAQQMVPPPASELAIDRSIAGIAGISLSSDQPPERSKEGEKKARRGNGKAMAENMINRPMHRLESDVNRSGAPIRAIVEGGATVTTTSQSSIHVQQHHTVAKSGSKYACRSTPSVPHMDFTSATPANEGQVRRQGGQGPQAGQGLYKMSLDERRDGPHPEPQPPGGPMEQPPPGAQLVKDNHDVMQILDIYLGPDTNATVKNWRNLGSDRGVTHAHLAYYAQTAATKVRSMLQCESAFINYTIVMLKEDLQKLNRNDVLEALAGYC